MDDLIVFFPIWLTSLILFAIIPTQRSEWPQFRIVALFVGKKFLYFAAWVPNWIIHGELRFEKKQGCMDCFLTRFLLLPELFSN